MSQSKVYKDNDNYIIVTNDKMFISKAKELIPDAFAAFDVLDLTEKRGNPQEKEYEPRSHFGVGTYHQLKPSDYIKQYGIEGALRMSSEKNIPGDMRNEVILVCANCIKDEITSISSKSITKEGFVKFCKTYNPLIGQAIKRTLNKMGIGSIENYAAENSLETLQEEYEAMCRSILKRMNDSLKNLSNQ